MHKNIELFHLYKVFLCMFECECMGALVWVGGWMSGCVHACVRVCVHDCVCNYLIKPLIR